MTGTITPSLWFDHQAEEAARFYTSVFPNSAVGQISHYTEVGPGEPGSVMTVAFQLDGQEFVAINGGPEFPFTEAVSFQVNCADQAEVNRYWELLSAGGAEGPCGWLKDRYGLSWQVVPTELDQLVAHPDRRRANQTMAALLGMKKLDIGELQAAFDR